MWLNVILLFIVGLWNSFCYGCNSQKFGDFADPKEALLTLASKASKQYGVTWVEKEPVINKNLSFASKLISFRLGNLPQCAKHKKTLQCFNSSHDHDY